MQRYIPKQWQKQFNHLKWMICSSRNLWISHKPPGTILPWSAPSCGSERDGIRLQWLASLTVEQSQKTLAISGSEHQKLNGVLMQMSLEGVFIPVIESSSASPRVIKWRFLQSWCFIQAFCIQIFRWELSHVAVSVQMLLNMLWVSRFPISLFKIPSKETTTTRKSTIHR